MRILVVDPDERAVATLVDRLRRYGHETRAVPDGGAALSSSGWAQLVLMEMDLPDVDGTQVCRRIRDTSDVYIIVVSCRTSEADRVLGLQAGSDDYIVKPYGFPELLARIEAVFRRERRFDAVRPSMSSGSLNIDPAAFEVRLGRRDIPLTRKEFELLYLLASEPNGVVTRERLMAEVWGDRWTPSNSRTIDTHVNSLRRKLGSREWIRTVRGIGFRIGVPSDMEAGIVDWASCRP
ncbi:response regulator transcription factor [Pseudonocardia sp. EC080619-01]|uniref:response regulator transcription factor n=1 Tax=Pseudonocardia sp. EC080619-01 TaxID=1096856 RepID=UPI001D05A4AB|nr:response regulator transcription factor [Pseudonocardia sp. EC080619-01]